MGFAQITGVTARSIQTLCWLGAFLLGGALGGSGTMASSMVGAKVWQAPNTRKIARLEQPEAAAKELRLSAARGERESLQLVISAGKEGLSGVEVQVSDLIGPEGARIRASSVEVLRAVYIPLPNLKKEAPDPLPPAGKFDVAPNENQPVWLIVAVPRGAKAGGYQGMVSIRAANRKEIALPILLTVRNFTLPPGPSSKTAFGIWGTWVARQHGVAEGSLAAKRLYDKYYRFLMERWISPYSLPVDVRSPKAERYVKDPRITGYIIPYNDDVSVMKEMVESLRQRGLLEKGYFYPIDEPVSKQAYERLKEVCTRIHQVDPGLRIVIPYYRDPDFETSGKTIHELGDGYLNIWCPNIQYFDGNKERLYARQKKGEEFWWYVCCGPGEPYPNFFLSMDGPSHRVLPWLQWKYHCEGLLYWATTWWNPDTGTADPWVDMATVKDINKDLYGDGSLLYPGKKVGIDGPVSSIRLELLREGLEDYEYLVLLERKIGRQKAEALLADFIKSPTEFERAPARWEAMRERIAEILSD